MGDHSLLPPDGDSPLILTPLLDLMFLVLIFFVLNLSFQSIDNLQVNVPQNENLPSLEEQDYFLLEITNQGKILINDESYTLDEMRDYIVLEMEQWETPKALYIAGDENISYNLLMKVLDQVQALGISPIHLLSQED